MVDQDRPLLRGVDRRQAPYRGGDPAAGVVAQHLGVRVGPAEPPAAAPVRRHLLQLVEAVGDLVDRAAPRSSPDLSPSARTTYTSTSERSVAIPRAAEPLSTSPRIVGSSRPTSSSRAARAAGLILSRSGAGTVSDASVTPRGPPSSSGLRPSVRVRRARARPARPTGAWRTPWRASPTPRRVGADYVEFDVRRCTRRRRS